MDGRGTGVGTQRLALDRRPPTPNEIRMDDTTPRKLSERTGRHVCTRCLAQVPADEYLDNDHLCDKCAGDGDYPLKSTPGPVESPDRRQ